MNASPSEINIESFQGQVLKEIRRLSDNLYEKPFLDVSSNFYINELYSDEHKPYYPPRDEIYDEILRELRFSSWFINKRKLSDLILRLKEADKFILRKVNEEINRKFIN